MQTVVDEQGFFKAFEQETPRLYKRFCKSCDIDFLTRNPGRKTCRYCSGPTPERQVPA